MEYCVTIDSRTDTDPGDLDVDEAGDRLMDALEHAGGAVGVGGIPLGASGTFTVEADSAVEAVTAGAQIWTAALEQAGIPPWPIVHVEAKTYAQLDVELARPAMPELVGVTEAAEILGVTRQRVSTLAKDNPRFPRPIIQLASGPVWRADAIHGFDRAWERRPGRPSKSQPDDATPTSAGR